MVLLLVLALASSAPPRLPEPTSRAADRAADDALRILVAAPASTNAGRIEEIYAGLRAAGLLPVELEERAGVDRPAPPEPDVGKLDDARAALQGAMARFRELDLEAARAAVDATIDEILRLDRPEIATEVLTDALLLRARLAMQSGADDDAREALVLVGRLEPAREALHPGLHPPSLVEAYAGARAAERQAPGSSLLFQPRVAGFGVAELLVDGRPARPGLSVLPAGPHLVTLRAPGTPSRSSVIVLAPEAPIVVDPFLGPPGIAAARSVQRDAAAAARDDGTLQRALEEISSLCAAGAVLFVGDTSATLFVRGRGLEPLAIPPTSSGAALGRATLSALQSSNRRNDDEGPATSSNINPLFVIGVGAASTVVLVAGIGAAVYALLPPQAPAPPPSPVVVSCCVD